MNIAPLQENAGPPSMENRAVAKNCVTTLLSFETHAPSEGWGQTALELSNSGLADVRESIAELAYYRKMVFK
jgi:hypothetical protein